MSSRTLPKSFEIIPWTGEGSGYMVSDGVCFSTFNFDTGSFIPIKGINQRFDFNANEKFYIDFSIAGNLQVTGAEIKCSQIGIDEETSDRSNPSTWGNYPNMIYVQPEDEFDDKGRVIRITDGKRQIKCYVLIGYRSDDTNKNGGTQTDNGNSNTPGSPVQILNSDLILLASMYSGVPIIFPVPYLNGLDHILSIKQT
jgi:hypothetical protein